VRTYFTPGRPLTALLFEGSQTLVINAHSINYRKTLINPKGSDAQLKDKTFSDMISYAITFGGIICGQDQVCGEAFSVANFPTAELQKLLGGFISFKIAEGLAAMEDAPCGSSKPCDDYIKRNVKKIVLAGDMNDETGELTSLPIFGLTVSMPADKRVRTCCSDRDSKWLEAYGQSDAAEYAIDNAYTTHAIGNWKYMLESNKYLGVNCTDASNDFFYNGSSKCIAKFKEILPEPMSVLVGQAKGAQTEIPDKTSQYPFAADLILTSGTIEEFGFPDGYVQKMGDGTISDRDPIYAKLTM